MVDISVIVPVYNVEKYLPKCIESILNQSYSNFELLLIDDGSTDNSLNICKKYSLLDNRIKVFEKENTGVSDTRNVGLSKAVGNYITFVDSDDFIEYNTLSVYMNAFLNNSVDIVKIGYYIDNENQTVDVISEENDIILNQKYDILAKLEKNRYYSFVWNSCIKKECIDNIRFLEKINWLEDHIFMYQCYFNCSALYVSKVPCYHYITRNIKRLSFVSNPKMIMESITIETSLKLELNGGKYKYLDDDIMNNYLNNIHRFVLVLYLTPRNYNYRRCFTNSKLLYTSFLYKEEKIYFCNIIPFFLRDLILKLFFIIKNKLKK